MDRGEWEKEDDTKKKKKEEGKKKLMKAGRKEGEQEERGEKNVERVRESGKGRRLQQ